MKNERKTGVKTMGLDGRIDQQSYKEDHVEPNKTCQASTAMARKAIKLWCETPAFTAMAQSQAWAANILW